MNPSFFIEQLTQISGKENVRFNEEMSMHTTFRVGGPADIFVTPEDPDTAAKLIWYMNKVGQDYFILGNGSNILVGDKGYRGTVISLSKGFDSITAEGDVITAGAGAILSAVSHTALDASLSGMEFASGIPGTLGGAMVMNAGAYGGEMKHVLESADVLTPEGEFLTLSLEELELGYRTSVVATKGYTVLGATIALEKGNPEEIKAYMDDLKERRITKQPLEYASAGSTFKRPEGYFAGKLIQDSGLKGYSVGDAQISEKHSGFVINRGNASAKDVLALIEHVQEIVEEKFGVHLETEVKRIGEF